MTDPRLYVTILVGGLGTLALIGIYTGVRHIWNLAPKAVDAALEEEPPTTDPETDASFGSLADFSQQIAEHDAEWADICDILGITPEQVRAAYERAQLADRIERIRTDIACAQFRTELEDWGKS